MPSIMLSFPRRPSQVLALVVCTVSRHWQAPLSWVAPIASAFYPGAPAPPEAGLPPSAVAKGGCLSLLSPLSGASAL